MKRLKHFFSFFVLLFLVWFSFKSLIPDTASSGDVPLTEFSTERAMSQLKVISQKPHYVGSPAHAEVRGYIIDELEKLGLEPAVQEGYVLDSWWGSSTLVKPKNIVARYKGTGTGKAVLLMSHYDSAPHSKSHGASDAGSGVVTVLESLRAYLAAGVEPENDIIVLFTDSEELGLDGATLFVKEHPWAKDVGIALNFEARGSSGPSNMIVETNGGNENLIKEFEKAGLEYPVATSLMYSIYKMLPNDTDSTVLREDGDIPGFFFAFIDSHYNYHTVNDTVDNLDPRTLEHQGQYLLPLIKHFAQVDLSTIKSTQDRVYFDAPLFTFASYPFAWVLPMSIIALVIFILLLFKGFRDKKLSGRAVGRGFLALIISLGCSLLLLQIFAWLMPSLYPQYNDMLPVFIYNGHWYTIAFVVMSLAFSFGFYSRLCKLEDTPSTYVAPLTLWVIINILVAVYLKGAGFFVIPLLFGLVAFFVMIKQKKPSVILMLLLVAPGVFVFSPLVQFFPVGLGPSAYWISILFTVLVFGLSLPVIGYYKSKRFLGYIGLILTFVFLGVAHAKSDYTEERQKPNSLLYYHKEGDAKAYWVTYDDYIDSWVEGYLGNAPKAASDYIANASGSKYNTSFSYAKETSVIDLEETIIIKEKDEVVDGNREVTLSIRPQRAINRIRLFADKDTPFKMLSYNKKEYKPDSTETLYKKRRTNALLSYYMGEGEELEFSFTIPAGVDPKISFREYSFDLLEHPKFTVSTRPKTMMPKPFVVNDAIIQERVINVDELAFATPQNDTLQLQE